MARLLVRACFKYGLGLGVQVELHHQGTYAFKGLAEPQTLVQVNSRHLADRNFAPQLPSKKAKCLAPGLGLQCTISLQT